MDEKEAERLQEECLQKTDRNLKGEAPCEICGKDHPNWHCCIQCNIDTHRCRACGDSLGHEEISVCYLLSEEIP